MAQKIIFRTLLIIAVAFLAYLCVDSVVTPIRFEDTRLEREALVSKRLMHLRTAEAEFKLENGRYTANLDSLITFLKTAPKKDVLKEGALTDKQLENGLTEHKATAIIARAKTKAKARMKDASDDELYAYIWDNDAEVKSNGLQGFRRDTIYENMLQVLYKGEYTAENIAEITLIPYTDNMQFEVEVNNDYTTSQGIRVPIMEARAPFSSYLGDLDAQELVNLIDKEQKLDHYAGLKFGDMEAPNNNAGNWE